MGWLRLGASSKSQVSFAEYRLFYRAFLQNRPIILRSLLIVATPYSYAHTHRQTHADTRTHTHHKSQVTQITHIHFISIQHTATLCNTRQHTATHCSTLPYSSTHMHIWKEAHVTNIHYNTLQHTATHCNTLQHTATMEKGIHVPQIAVTQVQFRERTAIDISQRSDRWLNSYTK